MSEFQEQNYAAHQWRARIKKRRGKSFKSVGMRELNLVAMMDMMTIILVFLLKSYSGSALSLDAPNLEYTSSTNSMVPEEALRLTLTKIGKVGTPGEITIGDDEIVLTLDNKTVDMLQAQARAKNFTIDALYTHLKAKSDQAAKNVASINQASSKKDKTFEGKILITADKETPFWLISQVLFTSASAGYDKYNLVSIKLNE